jgi:hypothetical protein
LVSYWFLTGLYLVSIRYLYYYITFLPIYLLYEFFYQSIFLSVILSLFVDLFLDYVLIILSRLCLFIYLYIINPLYLRLLIPLRSSKIINLSLSGIPAALLIQDSNLSFITFLFLLSWLFYRLISIIVLLLCIIPVLFLSFITYLPIPV